MFKEEIGPVSYVNLFKDEEGQSRGCGILEFESSDHAKKAVEKMHRHDFKGRKLVVKEDFDVERDKFGRIIPDKSRNSGGGAGGGGGGGGGQNRSGGPGGPRMHDRWVHTLSDYPCICS